MSKRHKHPTIEQVRELPALLNEIIPARWEDDNGHVNVTYYMDLYNRAGWPMFDLLGINEDYFNKRKMGIVDLENHIRYFRELHVGNNVSVHCRLIAYDQKKFHGMMIVTNNNTEEIAATVEFLALSVDLSMRKSAPIPGDVVDGLKNQVQISDQLAWHHPTVMSLKSKG